MSKRAFLVTFAPTVRVIVDVKEDDPADDPQEFALIVRSARSVMMENSIADYIGGETVSMIEEDLEEPYNPEEDD